MSVIVLFLLFYYIPNVKFPDSLSLCASKNSRKLTFPPHASPSVLFLRPVVMLHALCAIWNRSYAFALMRIILSFCLLRFYRLWYHHLLVTSVTMISVTLPWVCWWTWLRQALPLSLPSCPRWEMWVRRTLGCWDTSLRSMGQWVWLVRWAFTC